MQILFMATGAFAVPSMRALCDSGRYDILGLITSPEHFDRAGRPIVTPARLFAKEYDLAISEMSDPHSRDFRDFLWLMRPDLMFVCDFGYILPDTVLDCALVGGINLHGSLLPHYRGAAPVHWAILNGDSYTGVSVIQMNRRIDAGPVLAQSPPIPIAPYETIVELEERLANYGAELVSHVVNEIVTKDKVLILKQPDQATSKAPRLKKQDGLIEWHWPAYAILNHYRAMFQWPRSFTEWKRPNGETMRLILGGVVPLDDDFQEIIQNDFSDPTFVSPILIDAKRDNLAELREQWRNEGNNSTDASKKIVSQEGDSHRWEPGTVVRAQVDDLIVAAGEGTIRILQIQPAGKRMMDVKDFLLGYPLRPSDRLG